MIFVDNNRIEFSSFPDGTSALRLSPKNTLNFFEAIKPAYFIQWLYDNDSECMQLWHLVHHLRSTGDVRLYLEMPYIPNARMDRVKKSDEVFTLKWFAQFINMLKFDTVWVLDPHSNVVMALIDNIKTMNVKWYIDHAIQQMVSYDMNPLLCYPDEGAAKRYSEIIPMEYTFCIKHRDWRSGKIERLELTEPDKIRGRNILIVDDICSRGGTFTHTAKALKDAGAETIMLYVTHCESTIQQGTVLTDGLIDHVFTTDSILRIQHEKITVYTARR